MCLAVPGQVIEMVDPVRRLARVEVAGVRRTVSVGLLEPGDDSPGGGDAAAAGADAAPATGGGVRPGDWVLIHVGFAISRVDEEEAHATLEMLRGMGDDFEQEIEELKTSAIE